MELYIKMTDEEYEEYKVLPAYIEYNAGLICNPTFISACFQVFLKHK